MGLAPVVDKLIKKQSFVRVRRKKEMRIKLLSLPLAFMLLTTLAAGAEAEEYKIGIVGMT